MTTAVGGSARTAEPGAPPVSQSAYADDFGALSADARDFDRRPEAVFSRCTRSTAIYECLSYGADGGVRRRQRKVVAHGTAFGYKRQGPDTLLLTNDHVASWPAVTEAQHMVEGVPVGCKKISEALALVDDERDTYARDDVPATRVVTDPQLDVAILRARGDVPVMPWKIGHSSALAERNLVEVRGFPLGAFRATNIGKVISTHDHDEFGDWEHDDFVIDALLSAGNSGSPVLAISRATGEYELVGIYHAGYTEGSALNVVIGIDQVRDLMTTLKRGVRSREDEVTTVDGASRRTVEASLGPLGEMFFPFGAQVAAIRAGADGNLFFAVYAKDFPVNSEPLLVIEDLPPTVPSTFGELGDVWLGSARGLKRYQPTSLASDVLVSITRTLEAIRIDATGHAAYRGTATLGLASRQASEQRSRAAKVLARVAASRSDLWQTVVDIAEKFGPQSDEVGATLATLLAKPTPRPSPSPPLNEGAPKAIALSESTVAAARNPPIVAAPRPSEQGRPQNP